MMSSGQEQAGGASAGPPACGLDAARPSLPALFRRFLRFGFLAWGGPTAQIAMIREELVERERWIDRERFNRVLAVYQALPGPEAHELCVYFGMVARGRIGAVLAGLGFMLPGLVLMLLCSWLYVTSGLKHWWVAAAFAGCQPAVVALIARGVVRIGRHALRGKATAWLCAAAAGGAVGEVFGVPFWIALIGGGAVVAAGSMNRRVLAVAIAVLWLGGASWWYWEMENREARETAARMVHAQNMRGGCVGETFETPTRGRLLGTGLKAGLLTFGGAYTAIPFVAADAVGSNLDDRNPHGWMTRAQFLDGLAIGGVLPAPLIIFGTFVGYIGGGLVGALLMTVGIFLPAFSFTLLGHKFLERVVDEPRVHGFLDGVTAAVVGIMGVTAIRIGVETLQSPRAVVVAVAAFAVLAMWKSRWATGVVVLGAAGAGVMMSLV